MILKRLLSFSLVRRQTYLGPRSYLNFSTKQLQTQTGEQTVQQTPVSEIIQQAVQQVKQKINLQMRSGGKHKKYKKPQNIGGQEEEEEDEDDDDPQIVKQFLIYHRPKMNLEQFLSSISGQQENLTNLKEKSQRFAQQMQNGKKQILKNFEAKLNLTPSFLIQNFNLLNKERKSYLPNNLSRNAIVNKITSNRTIRDFQTIRNLIQQLNSKQFAQIYANGAFQNIRQQNLLEKLLEYVQNNHEKNFILNIAYEQISRSLLKHENIPKQLSSVKKSLQAVSQCEYSDVNPLKFYWSIFKVNPSLKADYCHLMLKQLNKLMVNGKNASQQLRFCTYFFLNQQISCKILSKILGICPTLTETVHVWVSTIIIISRIQHILRSTEPIAKINFNDIFGLYTHNQGKANFFNQDLPKILYQDAPVDIFQVYQKALKHKAASPKDVQNLNIGPYETINKISIIKQFPTTISYPFNNDPITLKIEYPKNPPSPIKYEKIQIRKNLVQSIIKGQYHQAYMYYMNNVLSEIDDKDISDINKYGLQAQNLGFNDKNSRALYVLKKVFRQSKNWIDPSAYILTENRFQYSLQSQQLQQSQQRQRYKARAFKKKPTKQGAQQQQKNQNQQGQVIQNALQSPGQKKRSEYRVQKHKTQGLFGKKPKNKFSSSKQFDQQKMTKQESDKHYENYLKTAKDAGQQKPQEKIIQPVQDVKIFDFSKCKSIEEVDEQFKKHISQINEGNFRKIMQSYSSVPFVGSISVLIKYNFYSNNANQNVPSGLQINVSSSFGDIEKNYGEYLKGCCFMFPLSKDFYFELLTEQIKKMKRHQFKRIAAHLILFNKQIPDSIITLICEISTKEKIGLTLLEIITLINTRNITITYQSLKKIAATVQLFKGMEKDLLQFLKNYCDRSNIQIETKLFSPYISNLVNTQRYQPLNAFLEILRYELRPKQYQINKNLSPQQNIAAEKEHKQKQTQRINVQLFQMAKIASKSFKARTTIPPFLTEILDLYLSKKTTPFKAIQYGTSLIIYSQNQEKFFDILQKIKADPTQNNQQVLQSVIQSLLLFGKNIKGQTQRILRSTLYEKQFDLNQDQLKNFGLIFKNLDIPGAFSQYLEYILKKQPKISSETKSLYYKIFNMTTDDSSKNQLSGLLDFIFNPSREKQRIQYKNVKIEEQRKEKILKNLNLTKKADDTKLETALIQQLKKEKKTDSSKSDAKSVAVKEKKKEKKEKKARAQEKQAKEKSQENNKQENEQKQIIQVKDGKQVKAAKQPKQTKQTKQIPQLKEKNPKLNRQKAMLAKAASVLSYDQNKKVNYTPKLSKKDERRQSVRMLSSTFLLKFQDDFQPQAGQLKTRRGRKAAKEEKPAVKKQTAKQPAKKQVAKKK